MKVGVLILNEFLKRGSIKTSSYFDRYLNVGIKVILDSLEGNVSDFQYEYLSMISMDEFDVVLISLNSWMDVYNLVYTFWLNEVKAEDLKATIIVGGIGFTNIKGFLDYADVFVFGCGEKTILDIWNQLEGGLRKGDLYSDEFWYVRGEDLEMKTLRSADELYQSTGDPDISQEMMGCPNKCLFCQYSWTRKFIDAGEGYMGEYLRRDATHSEQTFKDLEISEKVGHYLAGIDGFSERLRKAVKKNITNAEIIEKFVKIDQEKHSKIIVLRFYMICGYPSECDADYAEFDSLLKEISSALLYTRFVIKLHIQPFNAMALTPLGWEEAKVLTNWREHFMPNGKSRRLIDDPLLCCSVEHNLVGPLSHFMTCLVERADVEDAKLLRFLVSNKRFRQFRAHKQVEWLSQHHAGFMNIVREYEIGEPIAWDYIDAYNNRDTLIRAGQRFRKEIAPEGKRKSKLPKVV